jgi:hypothetical protein
MSARQQRTDAETANAVARGINIFDVRGGAVARRYMEHKGVPYPVIDRVLTDPQHRRQPSAAQSESEAIAPLGGRD